MHYQVISSRNEHPWLVFIHGAGGSVKTWKYQQSVFSAHFQLLLIDLRDHGRSKDIKPEKKQYTFELIAQDILSLLLKLRIERASFMSLSLGSMVLQKLALMKPGLVAAVVMAGGVFHVNWSIMTFARTANFLTRFLPYQWMYLLFSFLVMPLRNHRHSRRIFIEQSRKLSATEYDRWVTLYQDFRKVLREYYHLPLPYPALIVMGSQDYIFLAAARRYTKMHARATLEVLQGCGHICNIEAYEEFNSIALSFLKNENSSH